jgi:hypothetical protein
VVQDDHAREIDIKEITFNQAVSIPVWTSDEGYVAGGDRNAVLLDGRKTLVRAVHSVPADWQERAIRAELHVLVPGEDEVVGSTEPTIPTGEPHLADYTSNFSWVLPEEMAVPGTEFYVELFEVESSVLDSTDPPEEAPRYPADGTLEAGYQEGVDVTLVVVPLTHTNDSCAQPADMTEERLNALRDKVFGTFPVNEVVIDLREPNTQEQDYTANLGAGLPLMAQLRAEEGEPERTFYVGMVDSCMLQPSGTTAIQNPGSYTSVILMGEQLSSVTAGAEWAVSGSLGMPQADCGDPPNALPDYPYPGGKIGVWGFDPTSQNLHRPDLSYSPMTWCQPRWISDIEYQAAYTTLSE